MNGNTPHGHLTTLVSVSGGLSSYEALRRVVASRGRQHVVAVFADVKGDGAAQEQEATA